MGNSRHVTCCFDSNLMRHYTSGCIGTDRAQHTCVGLCQHICPVVRVDLMFVTVGNETDRAHKI